MIYLYSALAGLMSSAVAYFPYKLFAKKTKPNLLAVILSFFLVFTGVYLLIEENIGTMELIGLTILFIFIAPTYLYFISELLKQYMKKSEQEDKLEVTLFVFVSGVLASLISIGIYFFVSKLPV